MPTMVQAQEATIAPDVVEPSAAPSLGRRMVRGLLRTTQGRIGIVLMTAVFGVAFLGPFLAPHDPASIVGLPLQRPTGNELLGTDALGRDVLSRFLAGGWLLVVIAFAGTLGAYAIGAPLGLLAAYRQGRAADHALRAATTVVYSIPPIIASLVLVAAIGKGVWVILLAIVVTQTSPVIQIFRGFGLSVVTQEYVEVALARGERTWSILLREVAPNVRTLFVADLGLRTCWSVMLLAAISFLGFGQAPPAADWGLMISENRYGMTTQPFAVAVPALAIACLTIGLALVAEAIARSIGRDGGRHG